MQVFFVVRAGTRDVPVPVCSCLRRSRVFARPGKKTVAGPQMAFTRKHREFVSFGFVSAACQKTDKHSSTCHVCLRSDRSSNDAGAVQMRMMQP